MAFSSVVMAGDQSAAWENATMSAGVLWLVGWVAAQAVGVSGSVVVVEGPAGGVRLAMVHRPSACRLKGMAAALGH